MLAIIVYLQALHALQSLVKALGWLPSSPLLRQLQDSSLYCRYGAPSCQPPCHAGSGSPALYSGMRLYSVKNFFRMMRNCCGMLRAYLELNLSGSEPGAGCCRLSTSSCLCLHAETTELIETSLIL